MSVIIRLQNLPWSANALDIRNFFRGLSIPEGGVHIVGGELGDAFIAFSTDEDARQAMMMDGGKIKEIQVKLLLSSRSEMHKVIETARQSVPLLTLAAPAPATVVPTPAPVPVPQPAPPVISPFSTALGNSLPGFGIPGIGNPQEIPQPAVIEPPAPIISPRSKSPVEDEKDVDEKSSKKRSKDKERRRSRSHSRSRDRDRKDRKRDRRDRSRSRERRRRDRSRSRDRRDRKRDRKDRSRSRDRSPSRRSRDKRSDRRLSQNSQERSIDNNDSNSSSMPPTFGNANPNGPHMMFQNNIAPNSPAGQVDGPNRFNDPTLAEAFNKLQELGKKRNPNAFQGDHNGGRFQGGRDGNNIGRGGTIRRDGRTSRFDDPQHKDCCVAIRNAPNHTSYGDVRRFFPFMIDKHGIKMINDNMGRRTGNIFVRFCDPRSKQLALQRKLNELKGSQVTVEALDDETYESAVDSFLPYREENDDTDPNNHIVDEIKTTEPFCVLKLSDLPTFVKEQEVMKAFSDFSLLSIQLSDCRITRTKTAIVQFVKAEDAKAAFDRKDTYMFGRHQPTITPITNTEFENDKIFQDKQNKPLLDNLTTSDNVQEAIPRDPRQRRQQMDNGSGSGGMPGAMQQFMPNAPFSQNFRAPYRAPFPGPQFGGFPRPGIEPRAASNNWGNRMNFPKQPMQGVPKGSPSISSPKTQTSIEDEPLDCVLMKGLPREATDRTIVNFLADTGAVPARIHLMLDANGQPSGDCFCEFRSTQEARKAVTKHGQQLDGFRITVDLVMRSVVEEALEGPKGQVEAPQPQLQPAILGNGPPQYMNAGPRGFAGRGQFRGRGMYDRGGFDRGGFRGFDHSRGGFRGRGMWNERGMRGFDRGRGRGFGRGRGGMGGFDHGNMPMSMPKNEDEQDSEIENFGAPGCVISMENVPFRATVDDILAFFGDFELTQDDVIRRYNERGQATGDARVAFRTPFDAQRAIKTRHMNVIHDRTITLNIL